MNGHRGYYRDGWQRSRCTRPDAVRRRASGSCTTSTRTRPSCTTSPTTHPEKLARARPTRGRPRRGRTRSIRSTKARASSTCTRPTRDLVYAEPVTDPRGHAHARALAIGAAHLVPRLHRHRRARRTAPATRGCSSRTATRASGYVALRARRRARLRAQRRPRPHDVASTPGRCPTGAREVVARVHRARAIGAGTSTIAVDGEARATHTRAPDAVRHRAVRGHRRRHRPPLAGVVGALRAVRPVPVHGHAAPRSPTRPASLRPTRPVHLIGMLRELGARYE